MNRKLMIVEDNQTMREALHEIFQEKGITVFACPDGKTAIDILKKESINLMLLDMTLPDMTGMEIWKIAREMDEEILCIFMTAFPEIKTAVNAMREGAFDYINKPFELEEMRLIVDKAFDVAQLKSEVMRLRYERDNKHQPLGMIGESDPIKRVRELILQVGQAGSTPVLIVGESGTGKELISEAVHNVSTRKDKPLMRINCSAIPETLLESELFGHEKGAFTDAKQTKKGIFEMADTGSIFLDEIGDLNKMLQPKLLRFLESQTLRRVGGTKDINIDVRIISATNQELHEKISEGLFRADLLYRLNVFTIQVPPLRERVSDIPILAHHFLQNSQLYLNKKIDGIESKAIEKMKLYSWPGNIRELKNVIERACILAKANHITVEDCGLDHSLTGLEPMQKIPVFSIFNKWLPMEEVEFQYIKGLLNHCGGNKSEAARQLGISRVTLREKLRKMELLSESEMAVS